MTPARKQARERIYQQLYMFDVMHLELQSSLRLEEEKVEELNKFLRRFPLDSSYKRQYDLHQHNVDYYKAKIEILRRFIQSVNENLEELKPPTSNID